MSPQLAPHVPWGTGSASLGPLLVTAIEVGSCTQKTALAGLSKLSRQTLLRTGRRPLVRGNVCQHTRAHARSPTLSPTGTHSPTHVPTLMHTHTLQPTQESLRTQTGGQDVFAIPPSAATGGHVALHVAEGRAPRAQGGRVWSPHSCGTTHGSWDTPWHRGVPRPTRRKEAPPDSNMGGCVDPRAAADLQGSGGGSRFRGCPPDVGHEQAGRETRAGVYVPPPAPAGGRAFSV